MGKSAFEKLAKMRIKLEKKIKAEGADALKGYFTEVFEDIPELLAVRVTGYVPGFNDGDPCTFSLRELNFRILGQVVEEDEDDSGWSGLYDFCGTFVGWFEVPYTLKAGDVIVENRPETDYQKARVYVRKDDAHPLYKKLKAVEDIVLTNGSVLNSAFGDNFQIVITRDSITVDEYDCGF